MILCSLDPLLFPIPLPSLNLAPFSFKKNRAKSVRLVSKCNLINQSSLTVCVCTLTSCLLLIVASVVLLMLLIDSSGRATRAGNRLYPKARQHSWALSWVAQIHGPALATSDPPVAMVTWDWDLKGRLDQLFCNRKLQWGGQAHGVHLFHTDWKQQSVLPVSGRVYDVSLLSGIKWLYRRELSNNG